MRGLTSPQTETLPTRATVNRWAGGDEMPEIAATMIGGLFLHTGTPTPDLMTELAAIRSLGQSTAEELALVRAVVEALLVAAPQPDDDPVDDPLPGVTGRRRGR